MANQISRQIRQPIDLILGETIHDRYVFALDVTAVLEPLSKCAQPLPDGVLRPCIQKSNHRHCRLLRTSRERPCGSAAEQRDELASPHDAPLPWQLAQQLLRNA